MSWLLKITGTKSAVLGYLRQQAKFEHCNLPAQIAIQNIEKMDPAWQGTGSQNNGIVVEGWGHVGGAFYLKVEPCALAVDEPVAPPVKESTGDSEARVLMSGTDVAAAAAPDPAQATQG